MRAHHPHTRATAAVAPADHHQELVYEEFLEVLAHLCDLKVPAASREGVPFEETFRSWLQLVFIPTYRKLRLKADLPTSKKKR